MNSKTFTLLFLHILNDMTSFTMFLREGQRCRELFISFFNNLKIINFYIKNINEEKLKKKYGLSNCYSSALKFSLHFLRACIFKFYVADKMKRRKKIYFII